MRNASRSTWAKYMATLFVWLLLKGGVASASELLTMGTPSYQSLSSSLVIPQASQLLEGQPAEEAEEAQRTTPEAVAARKESETKYEAQNSENVERLVNARFPLLTGQSDGGVPALPAGESITGFPSTYTAQVDLGQGHHGVIDSVTPLAIEQSAGRRVPIVLNPHEVDNVFEPTSPLVAVRIAKQLSGGVSVTRTGISLTPVDSRGTPLGGAEGLVDGSSVLYANTQDDEDTVVKPSTFGFDISTILRSINSPSTVFYRVGMPDGASLEQRNPGGAAQVVKEGVVLSTIAVPTAEDATGHPVPVSMSVSSNVITVTAKMVAEEFEYPILIDPEVIDESRSFEPGVWAFYTDDPSIFHGSYSTDVREEGGKRIESSGPTDTDNTREPFYNGDYGYFVYNTQGASRIYAFVASITEEQPETLIDEIALRKSNGEIEVGNGEGGYTKLEFNSHFHEWAGLTICSSFNVRPSASSWLRKKRCVLQAKGICGIKRRVFVHAY